PELQTLLGVASAVDPAAPEFIFPTDPRHPTWLETPFLAVDPPTWWPDFGDVLTPAPGGRVIGEFELSGEPAMLETHNGAVLVNGLDWDDAGAAAVLMGRDQSYYLTGCLPDFDDNGSLDFFDFLAFQNAFAMGDRRADLNKDGFLSLFDFLVFQNAFELGCRPQ
ncbi:MAG: GC-type dockerin domain-anchored protein, partial [Phycisphaerales bacterium JB039]